MKARVILVVFCLFGMAFFAFSQSADELVAQADEMLKSLADMDTAQDMLAKYETAAESIENKYDVNWKMSRVLYHIGTHTADKKAQQEIFSQAIVRAEEAIALEPEKPDGHFWLAVNNGKFGESKGVMKSLGLVKPIKESMNKVIELDRGYEEGGADRVLGRVFFKVPGIAGGDKDQSLKHLLKSIEFGPNDPLTLLYLGETYLALNEIDKSREALDKVLSMEDDGLWLNSIEQCHADAKVILEHRKFRK
ncbi:TRAP transporter TatT component family protein [Acidobacteriota bacterium]